MEMAAGIFSTVGVRLKWVIRMQWKCGISLEAFLRKEMLSPNGDAYSFKLVPLNPIQQLTNVDVLSYILQKSNKAVYIKQDLQR